MKNRLDVAHALIDEHDYDTPVEIIQNLKTRIHETELLAKIKRHEDSIENEYQTEYASISSKVGDPYEAFSKVLNLKKWRSQEYLKYYDKLMREHDL